MHFSLESHQLQPTWHFSSAFRNTEHIYYLWHFVVTTFHSHVCFCVVCRQFGLSVCKGNLACLFAKTIWPVCLQRRQLHLQVKLLQRCTTPQKHCALEALSSLACPQTGLLQSLTWLSPQPCHHPVHIKPAHLDPPHSQVIDHLKPRMLSRTL